MKDKKIDLEIGRDKDSRQEYNKSLLKNYPSNTTLPKTTIYTNKGSGIFSQMSKMSTGYLIDGSSSNLRLTTEQKNSIAKEVELAKNSNDFFTKNLVPTENKYKESNKIISQ